GSRPRSAIEPSVRVPLRDVVLLLEGGPLGLGRRRGSRGGCRCGASALAGPERSAALLAGSRRLVGLRRKRLEGGQRLEHRERLGRGTTGRSGFEVPGQQRSRFEAASVVGGGR